MGFVATNQCPSGTIFLDVILRSPANGGTTKNLMVSAVAEMPRGVYPFGGLRVGSELVEGLKMTLGSFQMDTNQEVGVYGKAE